MSARNQYIKDLEYHLRSISNAERRDILSDIDERFRSGVQNGESEETVVKKLGSAQRLAKTLIMELQLGPDTASFSDGDRAKDLIKRALKLALLLFALAPIQIFILGVPLFVAAVTGFTLWIVLACFFLTALTACAVAVYWVFVGAASAGMGAGILLLGTGAAFAVAGLHGLLILAAMAVGYLVIKVVRFNFKVLKGVMDK